MSTDGQSAAIDHKETAADAEVLAFRKAFEGIERDIKGIRDVELARVNGRVDQLSECVKVKDMLIAGYEATIGRIDNDINGLHQATTSLRNQLNPVAAQIEQTGAHLSLKDATIASYQSAVARLDNDVTGLKDEIDKLRKHPTRLANAVLAFGAFIFTAGGVLFAYNFWAQYQTSSQLDTRSTEMVANTKYGRDQIDATRKETLGLWNEFRRDAKTYEKESIGEMKALAAKTEKQNKDVADDTRKENKELADDTRRQNTELADQTRKRNDEFAEALRVQTAGLQETLQHLQQEVKIAEETRELMLESAHTVHSVLAWISMGNQQLAYQQNPKQAAYYAEKAESALKDLDGRLQWPADEAPPPPDQRLDPAPRASSSRKGLREALDRVWIAVWILKAESYMQLADKEPGKTLPEVLSVARKMAQLQCNCVPGDDSCKCPEGDHFKGLALLHMVVDDQLYATNEPKRTQDRQICIDALRSAIGDEVDQRKRNPDLVFLSAVLFDAARYSEALKYADEFLQGFPETLEERRRLGREVQAIVAIATVWKQLSEFAMQKRTSLGSNKPGERPCEMGIGAVKFMDGRAFERLISRAYGKLYYTPGVTQERRQNLSRFLNPVLESIRSASGCSQSMVAIQR